MGKTHSLNDEDLREFVELQATFAESEKSWLVDVADVDPETFDLSLKNPNKAEEVPLRDPLEILEAIARLLQNRTSFVIAHRLSTVTQADRVLVIQQGNIAESGTQVELMAQGGVYANLYALQMNAANQIEASENS